MQIQAATLVRFQDTELSNEVSTQLSPCNFVDMVIMPDAITAIRQGGYDKVQFDALIYLSESNVINTQLITVHDTRRDIITFHTVPHQYNTDGSNLPTLNSTPLFAITLGALHNLKIKLGDLS